MRLLLVAIACCIGAASNASAADIKSISRLAAGPENVLFVADWKEARVHAITLPAAAQRPAGAAFNILDLDGVLTKQVGGAKVTVEDMVVRPGTAEVYIAVSHGAAKTPALIVMTSDQRARRVDLKAAKSTSIALRDAPAGNRLGSHFQTSIYSRPGPPVDSMVPFAVGDALSQALRSRM
jgi:hypothetical protein